ncbi:hypothetical protein BKA82DRAFT_30920 [Pisolithus tinctorius]|uniref:Uncharacterized protein n=1 Tax=Pisolithus tinctorius Marx 270 TaxID=870435 RepID=A0A0C3IPU0_PISTI|nr:hypothetical protein BKA82DRAFT_30920 [Pisolithus tinctorius]KIN98957.1 hypothetical protein M404DRAFT_30920 [Pisolithus tinctorius Marx 270]
MSFAEALLRTLGPFPKLLVAIARRCSSTTLRLLRYLFSLWNASARKWNREHLLDHNADPSSSPGVSGEVGASVESATILCFEVEGSASGRRLSPPGMGQSTDITSVEGGFSNPSGMQSTMPRSTNLLEFNGQNCSPEQPADENQLQVCTPPLRKGLLTQRSLSGLYRLLVLLDRPGIIERSLKDTQSHRHTDIKKWMAFSLKFQQDVDNVTLFATVLLSGNLSFLSLITQNGLSYWPQRLSYVSLLAALGSILMGLAVRTPRLFTALSISYFRVMVLVLGLPFELFLYSIICFIVAVIMHFHINAAMVQIYAAVVVMALVIACLVLYWLITDPREVTLSEEGMARGDKVY